MYSPFNNNFKLNYIRFVSCVYKNTIKYGINSKETALSLVQRLRVQQGELQCLNYEFRKYICELRCFFFAYF